MSTRSSSRGRRRIGASPKDSATEPPIEEIQSTPKTARKNSRVRKGDQEVKSVGIHSGYNHDSWRADNVHDDVALPRRNPRVRGRNTKAPVDLSTSITDVSPYDSVLSSNVEDLRILKDIDLGSPHSSRMQHADRSPSRTRSVSSPLGPDQRDELGCCCGKCMLLSMSGYRHTRWHRMARKMLCGIQRPMRTLFLAAAVLVVLSLGVWQRETIQTGVQSIFERPRPGMDLAAQGFRAHHPIVMVPGIVSTGLEMWQGQECAASTFRQRIWGSAVMLQAVLLNSKCWMQHLKLNRTSGMDPLGIKLRPAQGLEAADYLLPGYWIWARVIEDAAAIGYDSNSLRLIAYDWRLSFAALEERDGYFSRLKFEIESSMALNHGRKVVLVAHSMGVLVVQYFFKWVESPLGGAGGPSWVNDHIQSFVMIGAPHLGVPKAISAIMSGEMRDTAEMATWMTYLRRRALLSNIDMTGLLRGFHSVPSMLPKGGTAIWGSESHGAPDDNSIALCGTDYNNEYHRSQKELQARNLADGDQALYEHLPPCKPHASGGARSRTDKDKDKGKGKGGATSSAAGGKDEDEEEEDCIPQGMLKSRVAADRIREERRRRRLLREERMLLGPSLEDLDDASTVEFADMFGMPPEEQGEKEQPVSGVLGFISRGLQRVGLDGLAARVAGSSKGASLDPAALSAADRERLQRRRDLRQLHAERRAEQLRLQNRRSRGVARHDHSYGQRGTGGSLEYGSGPLASLSRLRASISSFFGGGGGAGGGRTAQHRATRLRTSGRDLPAASLMTAYRALLEPDIKLDRRYRSAWPLVALTSIDPPEDEQEEVLRAPPEGAGTGNISTTTVAAAAGAGRVSTPASSRATPASPAAVGATASPSSSSASASTSEGSSQSTVVNVAGAGASVLDSVSSAAMAVSDLVRRSVTSSFNNILGLIPVLQPGPTPCTPASSSDASSSSSASSANSCPPHPSNPAVGGVLSSSGDVGDEGSTDDSSRDRSALATSDEDLLREEAAFADVEAALPSTIPPMGNRSATYDARAVTPLLEDIAPEFMRKMNGLYFFGIRSPAEIQKETDILRGIVPPHDDAAAAPHAATGAVDTARSATTTMATAATSTSTSMMATVAPVTRVGLGSRPEEERKAFIMEQRNWANALATSLPFAPNMTMYALYGVGKPAERGYVYRVNPDPAERKYLPYLLDYRVSSSRAQVRKGVRVTDGDGTVPLISLGYMCAEGGGWDHSLHPHLNPAAIPCVVREYVNKDSLDVLRLSADSADHVDLIGNTELISDLLKIAGRFESAAVAAIRASASNNRTSAGQINGNNDANVDRSGSGVAPASTAAGTGIEAPRSNSGAHAHAIVTKAEAVGTASPQHSTRKRTSLQQQGQQGHDQQQQQQQQGQPTESGYPSVYQRGPHEESVTEEGTVPLTSRVYSCINAIAKRVKLYT